MDNKTNTFQIILIAIFAMFIIVGILVFSAIRGGATNDLPHVLIWGTAPAAEMNAVYEAVNAARTKEEGKLDVAYEEVRKEDFNRLLIEALASGKGPDAILISADSLVHLEDKIFPIPYESFSIRDFIDRYIDEGELFLTDTGILGLPLFVDPLVLYWNRDMVQSSGIVTPPKEWGELFNLSELLTKKDESNNILRSTIALGEYGNVTNAKAILSALLLQTGNPIVRRNAGKLESLITGAGLYSATPAESVVGFYTEFSNPIKSSYTWNRSLPLSKDFFISSNLAFYLGFGSEYKDIAAKNPNLNFDVAPLPQPEGASVKITYGKIYGFSILKSSKNVGGALKTIAALTDRVFASEIAAELSLAPARRDLLAAGSSDPYQKLFFDSAITAKGWLDPNEEETDTIFQNFVESVSSGRSRVSEAVQKIGEELLNLIGDKQSTVPKAQ